MVREILAARLARDASEFKRAATLKKPEKETGQPQEEGVPLEDVPPQEMMQALNRED